MKSAANKAHKQKKIVHPKAKITFRHNFVPPLIGIVMALAVMGFLNGQWLGAQIQYYVIPRTTSATLPVSKLVLDPNAPPELMIPSVAIDTPLITNETSYDASKVEMALRSGVVHYGTTALPGQSGNVVILGHSSGQLWSPGHYKYVFTLLNKVKVNALVYINYQGTRYTYRVTSHQVVDPTDLTVLTQTTKPELTLITCSPVGISTNRLVVHAVQISPKPTTSVATKKPAQPATTDKLPQ